MVRALNLIEDAAVIEVGFLGFLPAAEHFINGEQIHLREHGSIFLSDGLEARTVIIFCGNFLALRRIKELEVGGGDFFCAATIYDFIHDGNRGFRQDADRRDDEDAINPKVKRTERFM